MGTGVGNGAPPPGPPALSWGPPSAGPPAQGHASRRAQRGRSASRVPFAVGLCLVLGVGLLGGAAVGHWVNGSSAAAQAGEDDPVRTYAQASALWHDQPVDRVFPRTLRARNAGPGDADRSWVRIGVAPDAGCAGALDPALAAALAPAGCLRLLRATYTDTTSTEVTTVGLLVTRADPAAMTLFAKHWTEGHTATRTDAMPLPVAFPGTAAADFGPAQRGSWAVDVSGRMPVIVYAVSGFADGRTVSSPQPAAAATVRGATTVAAQAGLGFEAHGLATALGDHYLSAVRDALHPGAHPGAAS